MSAEGVDLLSLASHWLFVEEMCLSSSVYLYVDYNGSTKD